LFLFKKICSFSIQGRFEILALSGSYLPSENGGQRSRSGGLSVCLSGPDGRVLGGSVAGLLMAAAPVQVQAEICEDNFTVVLSSLSLPPKIFGLVIKVACDRSAFHDIIIIRISHAVISFISR
jgi:hypothetical protein